MFVSPVSPGNSFSSLREDAARHSRNLKNASTNVFYYGSTFHSIAEEGPAQMTCNIEILEINPAHLSVRDMLYESEPFLMPTVRRFTLLDDAAHVNPIISVE